MPAVPSRGRAGYSLVAVMVALVLLGIGVMMLTGANTSATVLQGMAQNRTVAMAIARSYLEEVRMRATTTVADEAPQRVDAEGNPASSGAYVRTVSVTVRRATLLEVSVAVDYPKAAQPVVLTTRVYRAAP